MGLLRRKPTAAERAAAATREAAVTASGTVQEAVGTASERVHQVAGDVQVRADRAADRLGRRADKARARAEAAGKRADKARRKAAKRAAAAAKQTRKAASGAVDEAGAALNRAADKADRKVAKFTAKADSGARKAEAKAQTAATKAQVKTEKMALDQAEKQRRAKEWNAARAKRLVAVGKVVAPLLAPYAMAAAGSARHRWDDYRSRRLGVSPDELGGYSGRGGQLHARISRIAQALDELRSDGTVERSAQARTFVEVNEPRLRDFASAVRAAEQMPTPRRKSAYRAVSADLDRLEVELLSYRGVSA